LRRVSSTCDGKYAQYQQTPSGTLQSFVYQTCTLLELQAAECITHTLAVVPQDMSGADAVQGLCRKYYQAHP